MTNYKLHMAILALTSALLILTVYQLWTDQRVSSLEGNDDVARIELRASDTGVDAVDNLNRQESIEQAIERATKTILTITTDKRDDLANSSLKVLNHIDRELSELEAKAETLPKKARSEWRQAKEDVEDAKKIFVTKIEKLETKVDNGWREARTSAGKALQDLAEKMQYAASVVTQTNTDS